MPIIWLSMFNPVTLGFGFVVNFKRKTGDKILDRNETTENAKWSSSVWTKVLTKQYNMSTCRRTSCLLSTQQAWASARHMVMTTATETTRYRINVPLASYRFVTHTMHERAHSKQQISVDHCILPSGTTCRFRTNTLALDSLSTYTKSYFTFTCVFSLVFAVVIKYSFCMFNSLFGLCNCRNAADHHQRRQICILRCKPMWAHPFLHQTKKKWSAKDVIGKREKNNNLCDLIVVKPCFSIFLVRGNDKTLSHKHPANAQIASMNGLPG